MHRSPLKRTDWRKLYEEPTTVIESRSTYYSFASPVPETKQTLNIFDGLSEAQLKLAYR